MTRYRAPLEVESKLINDSPYKLFACPILQYICKHIDADLV